MPNFLNSLVSALVQSGVFSKDMAPNHVLLNEYSRGQGIMPHKVKCLHTLESRAHKERIVIIVIIVIVIVIAQKIDYAFNPPVSFHTSALPCIHPRQSSGPNPKPSNSDALMPSRGRNPQP